LGFYCGIDFNFAQKLDLEIESTVNDELASLVATNPEPRFAVFVSTAVLSVLSVVV
jgi:hypothetical protein